MKKIVVVLLSMLLVLGLAACSKKQENGVVTGIEVPEFKTIVCGKEITNNDLKDYELYSITAESTNSQGNTKQVKYVGYRLIDVFKASNIEVPNAIVVNATDGYSFTYEGDLNDEKILLAISKDGNTFKDGLWFAPCSSKTTGDYLENLKSIEFVGQEAKEEKKEETLTELKEADVQDKTGKIEFTPFVIKVNDKELTNEDVKDLHIYKANVTVKNSKGNISEATYSGYVLKDVLKLIGIDAPKLVKVVANDGYESELTSELIESDITLIAIEKNKAVSEDGSIWLAPCKETTSGKYASGVINIIAN